MYRSVNTVRKSIEDNEQRPVWKQVPIDRLISALQLRTGRLANDGLLRTGLRLSLDVSNPVLRVRHALRSVL
jgi:hypothetical protein